MFLADSQEGFTMGAGAKIDLSYATSLGFDYGYENFGLFGGIQTLAVSFIF
jgi:opacity protein-like surface antigen